MNYIVINKNKTIIECLAGEKCLASEQDALELVGICGEYQSDCVMIHADNLSEEFFDLKTGVAGAILLKFSNYFIRAAAIVPPELVKQGKFHEMVLEANRGNQFRVFSERQAAEAWLISLK
jgi:PadR family transcriptional regulator AphA